MSILNVLVHINAYKDKIPTNNPKKSNFKWTLDQQGTSIENPESKSIVVKSNEESTLFSGLVSLDQDNTTTYDIALKSGSTNTYVLSHNSGAQPNFRQPRNIGGNGTTLITVTKNGPLLSFESTGGTNIDLDAAGVVIGDSVKLGSAFNVINQGLYEIVSFTQTSFQVKNIVGINESNIALGSSIEIFSKNGVQIGDELKINNGFSSVTFDTYEVTDVSANSIEIYSQSSIPSETNVLANLKIFSNAKSFVYVETDVDLEIAIDGSDYYEIKPMKCGNISKKGVFLKTGNCYEIKVRNSSSNDANVFYAVTE